MSPNLRVFSVSLTVLEIFALIVDLSLSLAIELLKKIIFTETIIYGTIQLEYFIDFTSCGACKSIFRRHWVDSNFGF